MHTWRSYHNHVKFTNHNIVVKHNHIITRQSIKSSTYIIIIKCILPCKLKLIVQHVKIFVHNHTMILSLTRALHCYTQPFTQWACRILNCINFMTLRWNIKTRRTSSTIESIIISIHFFFWRLSKKRWHFL
jgi:hypothetical protein